MEKIARGSPARSFNSDEDLIPYPKRDSVFNYGYGRAGSPYRSPAGSSRGGATGSSSPLRTESPRSLRRESGRGGVMKSQSRDAFLGGSYLPGGRMENGLRPKADPVYENENDIWMRNEYGPQYEDLYGREALETYSDGVTVGSRGVAPRGYTDERNKGGYIGDSGSPRGRRYTDEGPSYYYPNELYVRSRPSLVSADSSNSEMDKAELLRKVADLQEQVYRKANSGHPSRRGQGTAYPQGYERVDYLYAEDHYVRERITGRVSLAHEDDIGIEPLYRSGGYTRGSNMKYVNSYDPRLPAIRPHPQPHYHQQLQQLADDYHPKRFGKSNHEPDDESALREDRHHPNCNCSRCHGSNCQTHDHPKAVGPDPGYNPPFANAASNTRHSNLAVSDVCGSSHAPSRRTAITNQKGRRCHPFAGGAPFVSCSHCSELLMLSNKVKAVKQSRTKCGSCSTILVFDLENKKPQASVPSQSKPRSGAVQNIRHDQAVLKESVQEKAFEGSIAKTFSSETCTSDNIGYTFKSTDSEPSMPLEERRISFIEADKNQGILSPHSSHASKEEHDSDSISNSPLVNAPSTCDLGCSPYDDPLPEHVDYYDVLAEARRAMHTADRGAGTATDGEGVMSLNSTDSRTQATEIDVNTDEMPKTYQSQCSTDTPSIKYHERNKKDAGWFLPARMGKGSKNSSVSGGTSTPRTDVFVNGQPILHRAVIKAEKMAGPISPGEYWYDSRAGFWGVVGSYCLGIIPPYIQEFGFPIQADCSKGNTSVFVNGRELHETDLIVLARRGLPRTKNKYYALDISGRLELEDSGEHVADLRRLAPSVEKKKCGFGMKPQDTEVIR